VYYYLFISALGLTVGSPAQAESINHLSFAHGKNGILNYYSLMGSKDVISKQVLKHLTADIANVLLKLNVAAEPIELLETEQQRVEMRHADLVARVQDQQSQQQFILHIEIQNDNDPKMPLRMLRYYTDIQLAYPEERIRQYLIYIGKAAINMPDCYEASDFNYRYHILDMHTIDCQELLIQDTPDALVLAILCDFKANPVQDVVNYIVKRLHELLGDDEKGFRNYFRMLETLSENRYLQTNIYEAKQMLTQMDIKKSASFRWGLEEGQQKGREEMREEFVLQLLPLMDDQTIANVSGLPIEVIKLLRASKDS